MQTDCGLGHMSKMAAMPILGQDFKKSYSPSNQWFYDPGSWYVAFWMWALLCMVD